MMTRRTKLILGLCLSTALAACGGGGGGGGSTPTPPPPPSDNTAPQVSFSPATLSVNSGESASSTVAATDNVGVTTGPTVTCTNGTFSNGTYTAPGTTTDLEDECVATAGDAAGNSGQATLTISVVGDAVAPSVTVNPTSLDLNSGETASVTVTATDNVAVTSGPTAVCTEGSFSGGIYTAPETETDLVDTCTFTANDAAGNSADANLTVNVTGVPNSPTSSNISGKVTFDFVPHNTTTNGLNYNNITQKPARGVLVEAINGSGTILDTDRTNEQGEYSVDVDFNTDVRIRVKADLTSTSGARWDVKVTDNTSGNAVYAIQGGLTNTGNSDQVRDLNAGSGWGGSSYTGTRAAAPFAILDPIYTAVQKFVAIDSDIVFPPVEFRWSTLNRSSSGGLDLGAGLIGTSSYISDASGGNVYLLGDADSDTDEYDSSVVVHEWGHYFEDQLSRSDSVGGSHSLSSRLDPRVALSEGWGNVIAGIVLEDPNYRDSLGSGQSSGFSFSVETNTHSNEGWFNEGSVQSIMYDIFDDANEGLDNLSLGLSSLYDVLVSDEYVNTPSFTTVFNFLNIVRTQQSGSVSNIDALADAQSINVFNIYGDGETNNGGVPESLPIYRDIAVGDPALNICSVVDAGTYNRIGNRTYLRFSLASTSALTFRMSRTSGPTGRDPDFYIYRSGELSAQGISGDADVESISRTLSAGDYVIDAHDFINLSENGSNADTCFNFTIRN